MSAQTHNVESQKTITIEVAGATAAFALDSTYVEATAENGVVSVSGKIPGATHVIVVPRRVRRRSKS